MAYLVMTERKAKDGRIVVSSNAYASDEDLKAKLDKLFKAQTPYRAISVVTYPDLEEVQRYELTDISGGGRQWSH